MPKAKTATDLDGVWNPPSDRVLIMKAKVNTGWSSRSSLQQLNKQQHQQQQAISDAEFLEIEHVMQRATLVEKKELSRIGKLYERFNYVNKPKGNGNTTCIVCGSLFNTFKTTPRICNMCLKNCCLQCCVDTVNSTKQTKWLCKICSEYNDFWKKSGAWFHKRLPSNLNVEKTISDDKIDIVHETISRNSLSSSNSYLNEDSQTLSRKISKNSINDEDDDVKSTHSNVAQSSPRSSVSNQRKLKAYDNTSISGISDNISINENKNYLNADSISKGSRSSSIKDLSKLANNTEDEFKEESIDVQFQKYAPITSIRSINDDDIMTSTKNGDLNGQQSAPTTSAAPAKTRFGSFKSKFSSSKSSSICSSQNEKTFLGTLRFSVLYNSTLQQLSIHLSSASNLPSKDSNGLSDPYVKMHLLPSLAKSTKLRSKTVYKTLNPQFNETLSYSGISITDLNTKILRLTVLDEDKIGFDYIGEYRVPLKSIQIDEINEYEIELEEVKELGDDLDTQFRGKINFALKYSKLTQTLFVKIIRCTQLLPMDNGKSSDPFVEIALVPLERSNNKHKQKTTVKWKTLDPEYMEEFRFPHIDLKTLLSKTIDIIVWDKDFGSNDYIGSVKIGENQNGVDESTHFYTMIQNPDIYHEQWHTLKLDEAHQYPK